MYYVDLSELDKRTWLNVTALVCTSCTRQETMAECNSAGLYILH